MLEVSARRHSQWDANGKSGALPWLAGEVDCTIVQLDNAVRHGQSNARTLFFRGEIQSEDFILHFGRNSATRIGNADFGIVQAY